MVLLVTAPRKLDPHRQYVLGAEAGVYAGEIEETSHHETAEDEEHERNRDFSDDQRAPQPRAQSRRRAAKTEQWAVTQPRQLKRR